jgi:hypothetical protein
MLDVSRADRGDVSVDDGDEGDDRNDVGKEKGV